jgi:hypothetical protein
MERKQRNTIFFFAVAYNECNSLFERLGVEFRGLFGASGKGKDDTFGKHIINQIRELELSFAKQRINIIGEDLAKIVELRKLTIYDYFFLSNELYNQYQKNLKVNGSRKHTN